MSGEFKLDHITARCVATFDRDLELNQNFLRLLSIFPLALQAKGYEGASLVISLAIIVLDQCSIVANMAWKKTLKTIYSCYRFSILNRVPSPVWRYYLSVWLGSVSANFLCCDESSYSFKFLRPGDVYPAMLNREVNADFSVYGEPVVYNYQTDDIVQYKIAGDVKEVHYEGEIHAGDFEVYRVVSRGNEIRLYIDEKGTFYCKNDFRDYCHGDGYDKFSLVNKLRLIQDCEMLPVCVLRDNAAHAISMQQWLTSKLSFVVFFKASAPFHVADSTALILQ